MNSNIVQKSFLYGGIILLIYSLYGKLSGILELGLPSYGFNFAFDGFVLLYMLISWFSKPIQAPLKKVLWLFTIVGLFSCLINFTNATSFIDNAMCVLAPVTAYGVGLYISASQSVIGNRPVTMLMVGFAILEILCLISLIGNQSSLMMHRDFVFCLIFLTPVVALIRNRILALILFLVAIIIAILSLKRSVIIGLGAASIVMCCVSLIYNKSIRFSRKIILLVALVSIVGGVIYFYVSTETMDQMLTRMESMETDGGSGRDKIYGKVLEKIDRSDFSEQLFGHGFKAVSNNIFNHPAHNDLLEIAYDYGILTLITWVLVILSVLKQAIKAIRQRKYYYGGLYLSCFILWQIVCETNCVFPNAAYTASMFIIFGIISYRINYGERALSKGSGYLR